MQTARPNAFKITPAIKSEIIKIVDARIKEAHVTKEDFSELKNIVKDIGVKVGELAEAQKRTEIKVEELAEAQRELAEAQKRTEIKVEELVTAQRELAEAQKRTEIKVEALAEAQQKTEMALTKLTENVDALTEKVGELTERTDATNIKLGGLDRSLGYAFENEAYRHLPEILKSQHGIEIKEKIIRTRIGGREIDLLGHALREGREVLVVGGSQNQARRAKRAAGGICRIGR
jgi:chromosome segregation ATPase